MSKVPDYGEAVRQARELLDEPKYQVARALIRVERELKRALSRKEELCLELLHLTEYPNA